MQSPVGIGLTLNSLPSSASSESGRPLEGLRQPQEAGRHYGFVADQEINVYVI